MSRWKRIKRISSTLPFFKSTVSLEILKSTSSSLISYLSTFSKPSLIQYTPQRPWNNKSSEKSWDKTLPKQNATSASKSSSKLSKLRMTHKKFSFTYNLSSRLLEKMEEKWSCWWRTKTRKSKRSYWNKMMLRFDFSAFIFDSL